MRRIFVLLAVLSALVPAVAQKALSYPRLVVFGDNYSDTLNTYNATETITYGYDSNGDPITIIDAYPSTAYNYADGVFTNGIYVPAGANTAYQGVWHQQLNKLLPGVPLANPLNGYGQPSGGGYNYAWGAATTGTGTMTVTFAGHLSANIHNMNRQIDDYLNAGYTPDGQSLYVLFGGLNDLLTDSSTASLNTAAANVTAEAKRLFDAGAVNVMVANVPRISANAASPIDVAATAFRSALAADLAQLQAQYMLAGKTIHLTTFDLYTLYANIFANPAAFGFTDVVDKANQTNGAGYYPVADQYLNWDGTNPTTAGHHQIAQAACTALTGTVTTLAVDKALVTVAAPATLTATVSTQGTYGPQSTAAPTGTVTFYYPQTILLTTTQVVLGTATVGANGQASVTTNGLPPNVYTIYAVYNGDTNFPTGCNSNNVSTQVAVASSSFDFTPSPANAYIGMEEGVAVTLVPQAIGGFTGPITYSCSNLPKFFACSFTQQTVANPTVYTTLGITTGTPTKLAAIPARSGPVWAWLGLPVLLLAAGGRRLRRMQGLLVLCLGIVMLGGCATKSPSTTTTPGNSDPGYGTTHGPGITYAGPGTYTVTVTGTSGSLSVSHVVTVYIADTFDVGVIP